LLTLDARRTLDGASVSSPFSRYTLQFHGDGKVSGVCTSTDKDNLFRHVPYTGSYTVNPDCSGTLTATDENGGVAHIDIYAAPDGAKFSAIFTGPGVVDEVLEERVSRDDRF
jgi:hypothetical protein